MSIQIDGLDEAISRLNDAADEISQGITDALRSAGEAFVDDAQAQAPVDTGYLRDHISILGSTDREVTIHSEAPYSAAQEFGTSKMSAQPYFFQAIDSARQEFEAFMSNLQI